GSNPSPSAGESVTHSDLHGSRRVAWSDFAWRSDDRSLHNRHAGMLAQAFKEEGSQRVQFRAKTRPNHRLSTARSRRKHHRPTFSVPSWERSTRPQRTHL